MSVILYNPDKIKDLFTKYMEVHNLRKTMERYAILHHICMIQGHFDVEMLRKRLDEENFHVSRASIYNTMMLLLDARLIVRHQFTYQTVEYELQAAAESHHHAFCIYCGAVKEIKETHLSKRLTQLRITKFTYEYHSLYIYGMCSKCKFRLSRKQKKENNNIQKNES